jgi:hypothetical protein
MLRAWSEWSCDERTQRERRSRSVLGGPASCATPPEEHRPCNGLGSNQIRNDPDLAAASNVDSRSESPAEHDASLARFKLYPSHDIGGYDTGANGGAATASACARRCLQHTKPTPCLAFTMPGCQSDICHPSRHRKPPRATVPSTPGLSSVAFEDWTNRTPFAEEQPRGHVEATTAKPMGPYV